MSGVLFVVVAGTVAHLVLSRHGFSPTDEGFILAGARRLLAGQVPHRDFVSVRPTLSLALHVPDLLLGRDRCLLVSRWVFWLEMATISWLWSGLLDVPNRVPLAVVAFVLSAQLFPAMAWHTVDAILLATAGIVLLPSVIGYLLVGAAVLCRQNFALLIPVVALVTREPAAASMLAPAAAYVVWVAACGGWRDLVAQLASYGARQAFRVGVLGYVNRWSILGLALGIAVVAIGPGLWWLALPPLAALPLLSGARVDIAAFAVFAAAAGVVAYDPRPVLVLLVALAWCSSLSIGYPWPALLLGPLALLTVRAGVPEPLAWGVAAVTAILVVIARRRHPYRDRPVAQLHRPLGDVLRGGRGIRVSEPVYRMLGDLQQATARFAAEGRHYAVVPEPAAHWMRSEQPNPLSSDWPQDTELSSAALRSRLASELAGLVPLDVLLQKSWWRDPSGQPKSVAEGGAVANLVRALGEKSGDSEDFECWRVDRMARPHVA